MRVLFLGWEFPPHSVGGLGRHSYEIIKALLKMGVKTTVILPFSDYEKIEGSDFHFASIARPTSVYRVKKTSDPSDLYADLYHEIDVYTKTAVNASKKDKFDVIQANDWLTARAGVELKKITGRPLVLTMHSTEYDRTASHPWNAVVKEERFAINNADYIIAVSNRLKEELVKKYDANPKKISVIYNAIDKSEFKDTDTANRHKIVLYVGRLSPQKGIDHLIRAFKIVSENDKDALLYIVGEGSELHRLIDLSIDLGLSDRVFFVGYVSDEAMKKFYNEARVFVMPSVSEPFGITALEAVASGTPTIVSLESGASEILKNVFKVDFWDSQQMADMILGLLEYHGIDETMSNEAYHELSNITWEDSAKRFLSVYKNITGNQ